MKDRNGIEFQVGDVCVDYDESDNGVCFGLLCEIIELGNESDPWPIVYTYYEDCDIATFQHIRHLEIIGSTR